MELIRQGRQTPQEGFFEAELNWRVAGGSIEDVLGHLVETSELVHMYYAYVLRNADLRIWFDRQVTVFYGMSAAHFVGLLHTVRVQAQSSRREEIRSMGDKMARIYEGLVWKR